MGTMQVAKAEFQITDLQAFRTAYVRALNSGRYPVEDKAALLRRFDAGPSVTDPAVYDEAMVEIICDANDTMSLGIVT